MIGLRRVGPEVDGELRLDPQQIAPLHRPVVGELLPLQQPVDQRRAFVGAVIRQELPRLVGRGQRADHVEIDPSNEHAVGAQVAPAECPTASSWRRPARRSCLGESDSAGVSKVLARRLIRAGTGQRGRHGHQGRQVHHHVRSPRPKIRVVQSDASVGTPRVLTIQPHQRSNSTAPSYTREPARRLQRSQVLPPSERVFGKPPFAVRYPSGRCLFTVPSPSGRCLFIVPSPSGRGSG